MAAQEPVPCQAPGCGKPLRSNRSRALGYGPTCYRRMFPTPVAPRRVTVRPLPGGEKVSPYGGRDHSLQPGPDQLELDLDGQP